MAIDDIRLLPSCPIKNERFCDFEGENICNYNTTNRINDFVWSRSSSAIMGSGPPNDQYIG
jgi:hypothetical protein